MRHRKHTFKVGRNSSHRRCMIANMLKSLITHGRIETSVVKAKELRIHAEKMVTYAKKNTLATKRLAIAKMMIRFNTLTTKEARAATKNDDKSAYNDDRFVIGKLFDEIGPRFATRQGGYTRIMKTRTRIGDNSDMCLIEFLAE